MARTIESKLNESIIGYMEENFRYSPKLLPYSEIHYSHNRLREWISLSENNRRLHGNKYLEISPKSLQGLENYGEVIFDVQRAAYAYAMELFDMSPSDINSLQASMYWNATCAPLRFIYENNDGIKSTIFAKPRYDGDKRLAGYLERVIGLEIYNLLSNTAEHEFVFGHDMVVETEVIGERYWGNIEEKNKQNFSLNRIKAMNLAFFIGIDDLMDERGYDTFREDNMVVGSGPNHFTKPVDFGRMKPIYPYQIKKRRETIKEILGVTDELYNTAEAISDAQIRHQISLNENQLNSLIKAIWDGLGLQGRLLKEQMITNNANTSIELEGTALLFAQLAYRLERNITNMMEGKEWRRMN